MCFSVILRAFGYILPKFVNEKIYASLLKKTWLHNIFIEVKKVKKKIKSGFELSHILPPQSAISSFDVPTVCAILVNVFLSGNSTSGFLSEDL